MNFRDICAVELPVFRQRRPAQFIFQLAGHDHAIPVFCLILPVPLGGNADKESFCALGYFKSFDDDALIRGWNTISAI